MERTRSIVPAGIAIDALSVRMAFPLDGGSLSPFLQLVHELAVQGRAQLRELLHSSTSGFGQALLHPGCIELEIANQAFQILYIGGTDPVG